MVSAPVSEFRGTLDAHSRYFAQLLDQQGRWLEGDAEFAGQRQLYAFNSLRLELEDLVQAFEVAATAPLADVLSSFLRNLRQVMDNSGELHRACECAALLTGRVVELSPELRCAALLNHAMALNRIDSYTEALPKAMEALQIAELSAEDRLLARSKYALALVYFGLNRHAVGDGLMREARQVFANLEDNYMLAFIELQQGRAAMATGEFELARDRLQGAADEFARLGSIRERSAALTNLIQALIRLGHIKEAESQLEYALQAKRRLGDLRGLAVCNLYVAACHSEFGQHASAKAAALDALEAFTRLGLLNGQATALANLGMIEFAQGELDAAEEFLDRALAVNGKLGNPRGESAALRFKTMVALVREDGPQAAVHLRTILRLAIDNDLERDLVICAGLAGWLAALQGNAQTAIELITAALQENETRRLGFETDLVRLLLQRQDDLHASSTAAASTPGEWRAVLDNYINSQKHC